MLEDFYDSQTKTLRLPSYFNEELKNLPPGTKIIKFEENYNKGEFSRFNQLVDHLPNSVIHLIFGWDFNQSVNNLQNSITHLTFGYWFDQQVDNLPNSITHLTFGYCFNQSVDNLPNSVTHLTFEYCFNQLIDNLPNSITHLTFRYNFHQKVDILPLNLKQLNICETQVYYFLKIPFGCRIIGEDDNEIFV